MGLEIKTTRPPPIGIIMQKSYFDYKLADSSGAKPESWYEYSMTGFISDIDDRPVFNQTNPVYESRPDSPKIRLKRELHDFFISRSIEYSIGIRIDPNTFEPFIRCYTNRCNIDDVLLLKLAFGINLLDD